MTGYNVYVNGEHLGYTKSLEVLVRREYATPELNITLFKENGSAITRPEWEDYFLGIAKAVALRGDCVSRQIGAVIVGKDRRIVSTGYNGVPPNDEGCLSSPCPRASAPSKCPGYSDCRSTHAEANALLYADYAKCVKATLYISDEPCKACLKLIRAARIKRVVWPKGELTL